MITYEDVLWLMRVDILTLDAHYDSLEERVVMQWTWQLPERFNAVVEANKYDLYRRLREADGAVIS